MQIVKTKNRVSTLPRRQSRTTRSKQSISRATRKYRRNPDLTNSNTEALVSSRLEFNWFENDRKFDEFIQGKSFRITEKRLQFGEGLRLALVPKIPFGQGFNFGITIQNKIYEDGVYQEFHSHYQNNLRNCVNLNVKAAFVEWFLISYANSKEIKDAEEKNVKRVLGIFKGKGFIRQGNTVKLETKHILSLVNSGLSQRKIAVKLLKEKNPDFPSQRPKDEKARNEWTVKIDAKVKTIQNAIQNDKNRKNVEVTLKQFKDSSNQFWGLFVGEKNYVITPFDK